MNSIKHQQQQQMSVVWKKIDSKSDSVTTYDEAADPNGEQFVMIKKDSPQSYEFVDLDEEDTIFDLQEGQSPAKPSGQSLIRPVVNDQNIFDAEPSSPSKRPTESKLFKGYQILLYMLTFFLNVSHHQVRPS